MPAPFVVKIRVMIKKIGLLSLFPFFLFITTCVSVPESHGDVPAMAPGSLFLSLPAGNELVFIGVAGRRSNPKDTIQFALENAAQRVAAFYEISGEYAVQNNIGSGVFDYVLDTYTLLQYNIEGSKQYVDALKYNADTDVIEMENVLIIRTTYPGALSAPISYRPTYSSNDQKPNWVENPPYEISGYEVGVGYSGRYSSMANACTNSFHNAVFAIIRNVNTTTRSSGMLYQNTGNLFGYKTTNDNVTYSYGTLNDFYVLDMWINPKDKSVWTLAIAKKPN
jgi:hypothetical protein